MLIIRTLNSRSISSMQQSIDVPLPLSICVFNSRSPILVFGMDHLRVVLYNILSYHHLSKHFIPTFITSSADQKLSFSSRKIRKGVLSQLSTLLPVSIIFCDALYLESFFAMLTIYAYFLDLVHLFDLHLMCVAPL